MLKWINELIGVTVTLFARNWITLFGAIMTTTGALLLIAFLVVGIVGLPMSPYAGIIGFMFLPAIFVVGLIIIPIGAYFGPRGALEDKTSNGNARRLPHIRIDFNSPRVRIAIAIVAALSVVNLLALSTATYRGVQHMESVQFCGQTCHTVMEPEFTAYLASPHSRVACVECHIGPGAPWFVRSKLSGVRQVFAVAFNTYSHPIETPVENLRPARETCEECHWPERFTGDRVKVITKFSEDEENTPVTTVLLMHIGGGNGRKGGIHSWHIDPSKETRYIATDRERQEMAFVQVTDADGTVTEYMADGIELTPEQLAGSEMRTMDCMDCHNRPAHTFSLPSRALDAAIFAGRIDRSIPYIRKVAGDALEATHDGEDDLGSIAGHIRSYYEENYPELPGPERAALEDAIEEVQTIYSQNVFPSMAIDWGTYPNHIGHEDFPGCFRCHDGEHEAKDGKVISQDCEICHAVLAWDEEEPSVLAELGLE